MAALAARLLSAGHGADIAWCPRFTCNTVTDCDEIFELVSPDDMAINGVLRWLGVRRDGAADEFEAAGLSRYRWTDEWDAAAR